LVIKSWKTGNLEFVKNVNRRFNYIS